MARREYIRECFEEILEVTSQPGVHNKMAAIVEDIFAKVEKVTVDGDIGKHKKRKNPRTWKDSTPNTVYLD